MRAGVLGLVGNFRGGLVHACLNRVGRFSRALLHGLSRFGGAFLYGGACLLGTGLGGVLGVLAGGFQILTYLGVERNGKSACEQRNRKECSFHIDWTFRRRSTYRDVVNLIYLDKHNLLCGS